MCKRTSSLKFSIPQQPIANTHTVHGFTSIGLVMRLFSCIFFLLVLFPFKVAAVEIIELGKFHSSLASWKMENSLNSFTIWAWAYFPSLRLCVMPYRKCIRHDELEIFFPSVMNVHSTWPLNFTLFLFWVERESQLNMWQQIGFYSTEMSEIAFYNDAQHLYVNIWRISVMYDQNLVRKIKFASK